MRLGTLAFLFGILICLHLSHLPHVYWTVLCLPLVIFAWVLPRYRLVFLLFLGILWTLWRADMILAQKLPNDLAGSKIIITGWIVDLPQKTEYGWRFRLKPKPIEQWPNPGHLLLNWSGQPPIPLFPSQQWQLTVRLKKVHGMLNPGSFDYEGWSFQQRLLTIGYVQTHSSNTLLTQPSPFNINYLRYILAKTIQTTLSHYQNTGMIVALALGHRQWISQTQKNILQQTGIAHLMAISGLHIGLIAWLTFRVAQWFWSSMGQVTLWCPAPRFAALLSIFSAFFYALLAGFSLPTQRALIMIALVVGSLVLSYPVAFSHILALALLLILLWDPLSVMSAGFWLSFGAVTLIGYVLSARRESNQSFIMRIGLDFGKVQWAVTLGLLPMILAFWGYIPVTSLVANAMAIPWVSFIIVPCTLLGTMVILPWPDLGSGLLSIAAGTLDALWISIESLAQFKGSLLHWTRPPLWSIGVAMIGVAILLLPRGFPGRWLGFLWLLPLFFTPFPHPRANEVWFTLLDVGQGLAAVVRTENYVLVYDTGPKVSQRIDMGQAVVIPFLQAQGFRHIDKLLMSHEENDHMGGAHSILKTFPVNQILTRTPERFKGQNTLPCQAGQYWHWDGVLFEILHPPLGQHFEKANNRSCVLKVQLKPYSLLLPGDIEKKVEYQLIQHDLKADILVAPHHGSQTSSSQPFIQAVQPTFVLFSTGYHNRFGHPNKNIVQGYHRQGIKTWNTADTGAIHFRLSTKGISGPILARQEMGRFWHSF